MHSSNNNVPILVSEYDMPKLEDSLFNFPYSQSDYEALYLINFYQQQSSNTEDTTTIPADQNTSNIADSKGKRGNAAAIKEKQVSKKDRHSKINTVRGPRDPRMRLSLEVARKLFNLQDLLGFNKPSKTVDWLLKSSRTAITELERSRGMNQLLKSNVSESCEEVGNLSGSCANVCSSSISVEKGSEETTLLISAMKKVKAARPSSVARDSRIKARARARERTSQKKRLTQNQMSSVEDRILGATEQIVTNSLLSAPAAGECNPSMVFKYYDAGLIPNPHFLA